jgi:NADH:ubiquinone oxidoreductase subunit 5 (subunit L)/multisubunit Na+/H+ antiporter MnhA subunit
MSAAFKLAILRDGRLLAAVSVCGAGLALALAGTGAPEETSSLQGTAKRLVIDLPDWLEVIVLLALGLATLLMFGLLVQASRKRKEDEEDHEHYYEPPKLTWSDYVFLSLLAVASLVLAGGAVWVSRWLISSAEVAGTPSGSAQESYAQAPERMLVHSPGISAVLGTVALLISVGILGFMLWLYFGDWLPRQSTGPLRPITAGLKKAVADSLDDVLLERDPRRAIIKCYGRFETVLAAAHLPRTPWQTPMEFTRSVLQRCALPHLAVWELTRLFELARFSEHPMDVREREIALDSLRSISEALPRQEGADEPST